MKIVSCNWSLQAYYITNTNYCQYISFNFQVLFLFVEIPNAASSFFYSSLPARWIFKSILPEPDNLQSVGLTIASTSIYNRSFRIILKGIIAPDLQKIKLRAIPCFVSWWTQSIFLFGYLLGNFFWILDSASNIHSLFTKIDTHDAIMYMNTSL